MFDPDLLGEMVKIEQGSDLLNQIFNLIARYVRKVHSDEHIHKCLRYSAGRSFLDVILPGDIAYIVLIIKNSKDMWEPTNARVEGSYGKSREKIETIDNKLKWPEENSR
jgi:hypothetical protein